MSGLSRRISERGHVVRVLRKEARRLALWAKYGLLASPSRVAKPHYMVYLVTDRCNLRCGMCSIWKRRTGAHDMTLAEVERVFEDPWFSEVRSLNFNGGEPTLRKESLEIATAVVDRLPSLRLVELDTNGYDVDRSVDAALVLNEQCGARGITFQVEVSIDGDLETHNNIRGRNDAFQRSTETLRRLRESHILAFVNATLSSLNVHALPSLEALRRDLDVTVGYSPVQFRARNYTQDDRATLAPQGEDLQRVIEFYRKRSLSKGFGGFYYASICRILSGERRPIGCRYMHHGCMVCPNGDVRYCPCAPAMRSLRDRGLRDILCDPANLPIRLEMARNVCGSCIPYGMTEDEAFSNYPGFLIHRLFGLRR